MPYAIVRIADGAIVRRFNDIPPKLDVGKQRVVSPVTVGDQGLGHRFIQVDQIGFDRPGEYFHQGADARDQPEGQAFVGNTLTITRQWSAWTQAEINAQETAQLENKASHFNRVGGDTRALALIMLSEINLLRTRITDIQDAAAGATSLASFKSAMAAIANSPARTPAQLRTAFKTALEQ